MTLGKKLKRAWSALTGAGGDDPDELFQRSLEEFKERYRQNRDLVASLVRERDQLRAELTQRRSELASARDQALAAVQAGKDDQALRWLEREKALEAPVERLGQQMESLEGQAARAREALLALDAEVARLQRDRGQSARLRKSALAHESVRNLVADIKQNAGSPELDRARAELEHRELTQRFAQELDEADARASEGDAGDEDTAKARLAALKSRIEK